MVRKEIGIHMLAYNIIRTVMAEAGSMHNVHPLQISFKTALQCINNFSAYFACTHIKTNGIMFQNMLLTIVKMKIGNRPGRKEPRVVKRRPKDFRKLCKPRALYHEDFYAKNAA
jgi:hypothetical protein